MGLDQPDTIDSIGIDKGDASVVLSIIDGDDWGDTKGHLVRLQDKLNCYIGFVQSGEMHTSYPQGKGRRVVVNIEFRCRPTEAGSQFVANAIEALGSEGIALTFRVHE